MGYQQRLCFSIYDTIHIYSISLGTWTLTLTEAKLHEEEGGTKSMETEIFSFQRMDITYILIHEEILKNI